MQCEKKTRYETTISLFGCIANIVLNYILIKNFGIVGAALLSEAELPLSVQLPRFFTAEYHDYWNCPVRI